MSRIRSIKPEWLEDERLALASPAARTLSVALILLADDHGRGRAHPKITGVRAFPASPGLFDSALAELAVIKFVAVYDVDGQRYYEIRNWTKHQRVDNAGKPLVPPPSSELTEVRGEVPRVAEDLREPPLETERETEKERKGPVRRDAAASRSALRWLEDPLRQRLEAVEKLEPKIELSDLRGIAAWIERVANKTGDPRARVLEQTLDGFFADEWIRTHEYPIPSLRKRCDSFHAAARKGRLIKGQAPPAPHASFRNDDPDVVFGLKGVVAQ